MWSTSRCGHCSPGACGLEVKTETGKFGRVIITAKGIRKERYMVSRGHFRAALIELRGQSTVSEDKRVVGGMSLRLGKKRYAGCLWPSVLCVHLHFTHRKRKAFFILPHHKE